jgi:CheY-like chemotaxis protein
MPFIRSVRSQVHELNADLGTDSSRRAVEAADNVVHAYDMNMGVPETPITSLGNDALNFKTEIPVTGNTLLLNQYRGTKRRREEVATWTKQVRVARSARQRTRHSASEEPPKRKFSLTTPGRSNTGLDTLEETCSHGASATRCDGDLSVSPLFASEHSTVPGLRHANIRDVLQYVINDALKVGGRPDSAVAEETDLGEKIKVRTRSSSGQTQTKMIEWIVSPDVPETILIDEKDLAKMISCVALNAIKFTADGTITLTASLSAKAQYIVVNVKDSGSGIPAAFLPNLFKPFSREDDSTTRRSEGLGLGLMVAKGLARKLGGDLFCVESRVDGPEPGSEFEIRIPLSPGDVCSRPASPFGSPTTSAKSCRSRDLNVPPPLNIAHQPTTPPLSNEPFKADLDASYSLESFKTAPTLHHLGLPSPRSASPVRPRARSRTRSSSDFDKKLALSHPLNILIVDDNRINRHVLRHMLKNLGYTNISEAYDGNDAVQKIRKNAEGPAHEIINIVLMDIWMPLLDGFQATEAILKMDHLIQKPTILAVSADVTDTAIERAGEVGMKGFLTKPFVIRHVEKLIQQHYAAIKAF